MGIRLIYLPLSSDLTNSPYLYFMHTHPHHNKKKHASPTPVCSFKSKERFKSSQQIYTLFLIQNQLYDHSNE